MKRSYLIFKTIVTIFVLNFVNCQSQSEISKTEVIELAQILITTSAIPSGLKVEDMLWNSKMIEEKTGLPQMGDYLLYLKLFDSHTYFLTKIYLELPNSIINEGTERLLSDEPFRNYVKLLQSEGWRLFTYTDTNAFLCYYGSELGSSAELTRFDLDAASIRGIHGVTDLGILEAVPYQPNARNYVEAGVPYSTLVMIDYDRNSRQTGMICSGENRNKPEVRIE
jgi:hypothetical protein